MDFAYTQSRTLLVQMIKASVISYATIFQPTFQQILYPKQDNHKLLHSKKTCRYTGFHVHGPSFAPNVQEVFYMSHHMHTKV